MFPTIGILAFWLALPAGPVLAQSAAAPAVPLGPNPSECEIQAARFGAACPGCPPLPICSLDPSPGPPARPRTR
ncbi:hypothetical protein GAY28_31465, partial [Azospirillum brasilense]|nr:hypothetical protein [Azospirillum brasilense]